MESMKGEERKGDKEGGRRTNNEKRKLSRTKRTEHGGRKGEKVEGPKAQRMKRTKDKKSEGQGMKSMNNQVQNEQITKNEKDEQ
ncbi:hypothetical protein Zmor_026065 [Zophobas morio]|uniref:Uncharacterized protein n=1 Tax=Zophobas morio TaxID=2755281 RepID=A0AA38HVB4_9CUCU|nr:hypothetical protein Zmor_026065 [Zophobas morio]